MRALNVSRRQERLSFRTPEALLALFAVALLLSMMISVGGYLYVSATRLLSEYRRHLNAAAYQTQLYFDQREVLIRALAATAVRLPVGGLQGGVLGDRAVPLPVPEDEGQAWALLLTPRYLAAIRRVGGLVYVRSSPMVVAHLALDGHPPAWRPEPGETSHDFLRVEAVPQGRQIPVIWLGGGSQGPGGLTVYSPLNRQEARSGWLGLELRNLREVLAPAFLPADTIYALYDRDGRVVMGDAGLKDAALADGGDDYYGLAGNGWLPRYVLLSKSIGAGGLRVKYALPLSRLLKDGAPIVRLALGLSLVFALGVLLFSWQIWRCALSPMRRQYRELSESLSLNQALLSTVPVGLALVDGDRRVVHLANAQARSWLSEDGQWRDRILGPEETDKRTDVCLPDGRVVHVDAVRLEYQGRRATLCLVQDISVRKRMEDNLAQAHRLAEVASQAKTRFLAMLSHEIRTPLHGIIGTLELLDPLNMPAGDRPYFEALQQSARTLLRIVNDALDLSQVEAGHIHIESQAFRPAELVDEIVSAYEAAARMKGLHLYSIMGVEMETGVMGDPLRLRQILGNLVSNAIKFTTAGHVIIRAQAKTDDRGMALRFQVVDSGAGIAPDDLPHLFEPYFSAGKSGGDGRMSGTGLGLPISRMLAELMGGSLRVASEPGLGTSMVLAMTLPLAEAAEDALRPPPVLNSLRVHVVGAAPEIVGNVCQWLRHWGACAVPCDDRPLKAGDLRVCLNQYFGAVPAQAAGVRIERMRADPGGRARDEVVAAWVAEPSVRAIGLAIQALQEDEHGAVLGEEDRVPAGDEAGARAPVRSSGRKALLVDDHPINLLVLRQQFLLLGYEVAQASSAEAVLQRGDIDSFSVILTDVHMSGLDGYALSRALRDRGYCGVILGTTADPLVFAHQKWASAGMDDLLIKPFSLSALKDRLNSFSSPGGT